MIRRFADAVWSLKNGFEIGGVNVAIILADRCLEDEIRERKGIRETDHLVTKTFASLRAI